MALPEAGRLTGKRLQLSILGLFQAIGTALTWYNATNGSRFGSAPTPITTQGGSVSYAVTQTVDGCESTKNTLIVTVQATPKPVVGRTTVELCQNQTTTALDATGTSLKWYLPDGSSVAQAPAPATTNPTQQSGDAYAVTQTINGCESERATIRVFVQSTPGLSLSGTATVNLGQDAFLRLSFTGVGPFTYRLSDGTTGTATKDTIVSVLPIQTTTYQVVTITNKCGTGNPATGASAVVLVNIPRITTLALSLSAPCAGDLISANFSTQGSFNTGNVFQLQMARVETDSSRIRFVDLPAGQASAGSASGFVPVSTIAGTYLVRVKATNPKIPILGSNSPTVITVRAKPTATLTGNSSIYAGETAKLSVAFTGDGPWSFAYADTLTIPVAPQPVTTSLNPYTIEVKPLKNAAYRVQSVSNGCGNGSVTGAVLVIVQPLLGIEDPVLAGLITVYPVPASGFVTVEIAPELLKTGPATLTLTDATGRMLWQQETREAKTPVSLQNAGAGAYFVRVKIGEKQAVRRIMKL